MRKIVILSDSSEQRGTLASCLRRLFPECGIEMQSRQIRRHRDFQKPSGPLTEDAKVKIAINGNIALITLL